jgi:hypothetical protein
VTSELSSAKRLPKHRIFDRLEKLKALFSGELRAILSAELSIRNGRVEDGAAARGADVRAAWSTYPPCRDEMSARLMITLELM